MWSCGYWVLLLLLPASPAVEPVIRDLRLVIEARPTTFDYRWRDQIGERSGSQSGDRSWSAGLGLRYAWSFPGRPLAFLTGVEAMVEQDSFLGSDRLAGLIRLEVGLAIGLGNRWTAIAAPMAGLGSAQMDLHAAPFGSLSLDGETSEYGARLGLRWAYDRSWALGLDGGWLRAEDQLEGEGSLDTRRSGAWLALSLSWVLDPVAKRLE